MQSVTTRLLLPIYPTRTSGRSMCGHPAGVFRAADSVSSEFTWLNLMASNVVVSSFSWSIPWDTFESAILSACSVTGHYCHCFWVYRRVQSKPCLALSQFLSSAAAKQFLRSAVASDSLLLLKSFRITPDKTPYLVGGSQTAYKRELKDGYIK